MTDSETKPMLSAAGYDFHLANVPEGCNANVSAQAKTEEGVTLIEVELKSQPAIMMSSITLSWLAPMCEVHYKWNPACGRHRPLDVMSSCMNNFSSRAMNNAPVSCLYSLAGTNTLCFALSDAVHECDSGIKIQEDGFCKCHVTLLTEPPEKRTEYRATVRIDERSIPYYDALAQVGEWWQNMPEYCPLPVQEKAKAPLYSTWYAFHGDVEAGAIEHQCKMASKMGMEVVIVDGGWVDHDEEGKGTPGHYAVDEKKFPDFKQHVANIQALGMKFMLWFALPWIWRNVKEFESMQDMCFPNIGEKAKTSKRSVLDPRYPEVREFVISTYELYIKEYNVDGLKLDFIAAYGKVPEDEKEDARRDYKSLPAAVDRMLSDAIVRFRKLNPDILIEYRQPYIGPVMRKSCNIFRAVDCGNCFADNRIRIIDTRLLCGNTAVHSDMLFWHPQERVQSAAMQLLHVLFSVPQISVKLDEIPEDHQAMINCYLEFWCRHRDVLLDGKLMPQEPHSLYPLVLAQSEAKFLAAVYGNVVVPLGAQVPGEIIIVNGTYSDQIVVECDSDVNARTMVVTSCTGEELSREEIVLKAGLHRLNIPSAGYAVISQVGSFE